MRHKSSYSPTRMSKCPLLNWHSNGNWHVIYYRGREHFLFSDLHSIHMMKLCWHIYGNMGAILNM
jgi:hypothetical protein